MDSTATIVGAVKSAAQAVNVWFHAPFRQTAYSPATYFALVGLVLIFAAFWYRIIGHMEREV